MSTLFQIKKIFKVIILIASKINQKIKILYTNRSFPLT